MKAFGDVAGITFNRRLVALVAGHQRVEQLRLACGGADPPVVMLTDDLGYLEVGGQRWSVRFVDLDETEHAAAAVAANNAAIQGHWSDGLGDVLGKINAAFEPLRLDVLAMMEGIDTKAFGSNGGGTPEDAPEPDIDRAAELQKQWNTSRGQLWAIRGKSGIEHRLMIGDSTVAADVERLMGGERADVAVVDPPFELSDDKWTQWIIDPCIVFGQAKHIRKIPDELWRFERIIVKKYRHRSATVQIDHRHAFVAQVGSIKTLPKTSETFSSVIEQDDEREHNYSKPVWLVIEHLTKWMEPWAIVVDPFCGSGTTICAAEILNRKCYACELDTGMAAVTLERLAAMDGECSVLSTV